jgi:hypothetical protein
MAGKVCTQRIDATPEFDAYAMPRRGARWFHLLRGAALQSDHKGLPSARRSCAQHARASVARVLAPCTAQLTTLLACSRVAEHLRRWIRRLPRLWVRRSLWRWQRCSWRR